MHRVKARYKNTSLRMLNLEECAPLVLGKLREIKNIIEQGHPFGVADFCVGPDRSEMELQCNLQSTSK